VARRSSGPAGPGRAKRRGRLRIQACARRLRSFGRVGRARSGELGNTVDGPGPANLIPFIQKVFQSSNTFQFVKYEKGTSRTPKNSKPCMGMDNFKWYKFLFWPNFQIPVDFEL
jgi:hypothetical protein